MRTARLQGRSRGRRAALALLVVTVVAAAVSAFLGRGYFVDSWWMWRLRSTDPEVRVYAAQKLGERKCLQAVPAIVRLIVEDGDETVWFCGRGSSLSGSGEMLYEEWREASPLVLALWNMGEDAIPVIESLASHYERGPGGKPHWILYQLRKRDTPMKPRRE